MDAVSSGDESDAEPMSKEMLKVMCDGSQSHLSVIRIDARYKISDLMKQIQAK